MLIFLITAPILIQIPKAQADDSATNFGNKGLSFLEDVIQLDMSKYKVTLYSNESNGTHLFYKLHPIKDSLNVFDTDAIFDFYNGTLGSCHLFPSGQGLIYRQPFTDRFNVTLGIVQRFESWANDEWVRGMEDLMVKVGTEKNTFQVLGDESLRITVRSSGLGEYKFSQYYEGVEYTGLSISMGNSSSRDVFFTDSRAFHTIGNTTVSISRDQAISIAEDYMKKYSYKHTFGNGTSVTVSNLEVAGIYSADLGTNPGYAAMQSINNSTLFPYWDIKINVNNMPARGLQGVGVVILANDGTVVSSYQFSNMDVVGPLLDVLFFPITVSLLATLIAAVAIPIVIVIVLVIVLKIVKEKKSYSGYGD
jgi:hypothetical protein